MPDEPPRYWHGVLAEQHASAARRAWSRSATLSGYVTAVRRTWQTMTSMATWLGDWHDHDWQVWDYSVSHAQLHVRGIPAGDPGGPCVELLFKPVYRLATSTMSWSGLRVALRRVTAEGQGVFFLVSAGRPDGRHKGHGVVRAGSLHVAEGGLTYSDTVLQRDAQLPWQTLWNSSAIDR